MSIRPCRKPALWLFIAALISIYPASIRAQTLTAPTPDVAAYLEDVTRLERIALRLADAAGGQCANRWRHPGLQTHSRDDYPRGLRRQLRGFADRDPTVLIVRASALKAAINPGDQVVGPDQGALRSDSLALQAQLALGRLTIRRGGETLRVPYAAPQICYRPVQLTRSFEVEARTEPNRILLSQGLLGFVQREDELAFVIAHEMSHFMLGHPQRLSAARQQGQLGPSLRRTLETEADQAAIFLLQHAGYDPGAGVTFHQRSSLFRDIPLLGLSSHPTRSTRIADIERALLALGDPSVQTVRSFVDDLATD